MTESFKNRPRTILETMGESIDVATKFAAELDAKEGVEMLNDIELYAVNQGLEAQQVHKMRRNLVIKQLIKTPKGVI